MKRNIVRSLSIATLTSAAILAAPAQAQTTSITTGTIDVTLTLTPACVIETQDFYAGGTNAPTDYDPLAFPNTPSVSSVGDAIAEASLTIDYKCSVGATPTLAFDEGIHDDLAGRRMKHSTLNFFVPYSLFRDTARTDVIAVDGSVDLTTSGTNSTVTIYGRATIPPSANIGAYTDTVTVTLTL